MEWDEDNPDYQDDDYGYDEYPPEDQEQDQEPQGDAEEEEPYGYEWGGEDEPDEQEQPEHNESMVKTILIEMMKYAEEETKEQKEKLSLSSLAVEDEVVCIKRSDVLLDGGASHHVYYGPKIPEGALRREVELAHGTKVGYVKGSDITFIDKSISEE